MEGAWCLGCTERLAGRIRLKLISAKVAQLASMVTHLHELALDERDDQGTNRPWLDVKSEPSIERFRE